MQSLQTVNDFVTIVFAFCEENRWNRVLIQDRLYELLLFG